jgi:Fic family protein
MKPEEFTSDRAGRLVQTPRDYLAFIPNPLPPTIIYSPELIRLLADAAGALGELAGLGRMLANPYSLVNPALHQEAVLSSKIEGTLTEIEDLFIFEADPSEQPEKPDVREVHNYVVALEYGLKSLDTLPVSLRLLREIHERLMDGVRGGQGIPGEFRTTQNWIGRPGALLNNATFVPPPQEELPRVLGEWESYIHSKDETHSLVRLAFIHYQFEAIHPFVDGNGRVGRLLLILLLCRWGLLPQPLLYLSAFFERHRDDYYRCLLRVSQRGEWEEWLEFFLTGVRVQAQDSLATAETLLDLQDTYRSLLQGKRTTKITASVSDYLFARPVVTAPLIRDLWSVSHHTAQNALEDLERAGILHEVTGQRRNRAWVARGITRILMGLQPQVSPETEKQEGAEGRST